MGALVLLHESKFKYTYLNIPSQRNLNINIRQRCTFFTIVFFFKLKIRELYRMTADCFIKPKNIVPWLDSTVLLLVGLGCCDLFFAVAVWYNICCYTSWATSWSSSTLYKKSHTVRKCGATIKDTGCHRKRVNSGTEFEQFVFWQFDQLVVK